MGFSKEWDDLYRNNRHMSVWPWSQLVSLCLRHTPLGKKEGEYQVLEVGCGAGANLPFFCSYSDQVYALDGSEHIVTLLKERFPSLASQIKVADFTKEIPFTEQFDLIVDRGASVHNDTASIARYLSNAYTHLKPGGHLIITDWFSTEHGYFDSGTSIAQDHLTKYGYETGPFAGVGKVHFFDRATIMTLTEQFDLIHLEHQITQVDGIKEQGASWSLVLSKPE
ncbi:class I SAM-dependent methyltransferase [Pseudoalteromonas viridis]|uniref:Class I SAM-dependent methyltransferase n=1 Tax=Pseudoalteromonas viridis TaxID=339617 RepID=A0ABX7V4R6_9GAMM|nr:class I SAM-dependent methyltransferase [Pseudoalteromonas viridis]QTL34220.1 class I SAM-dependent methyltransferase [Pseudoalteromonas viridis]